jgi:DNA polymerase
MLKLERLKQISNEILILKESPLYLERIENNYIPVTGEGNCDTQVVFIGEAPGKKEAQTGKPFCGASGKVLDQLLEHIKMKREDVYITNIVKDRPTSNRDPEPNEIDIYAPFLIRQIEIIQPKVIATLGRFSTSFIMKHFGLQEDLEKISIIHGKVFSIDTSWGKLSIIPLYHPAVAVYNRTRLDELKKDFEMLKKLIRN